MKVPGADAPRSPLSGGARAAALAALGVSLARKGAMMNVAFALGALTVLGAVGVALRVASSGAASLVAVSAVASSALAWGAGALAAFTAATQSFERDRQCGVRALLRARGVTPGAYLFARLGGVVAVVATLMSLGALLVGAVTVLVATHRGDGAEALRGALAAAAYGLAFAVTVGALAMAALAPRARGGGYAWLVSLLVLPELVAPALARVVPRAFRDLTSVPSALAAVRRALSPPDVDGGLLMRAAVVLAAIVLLSVASLRAELLRGDATSRARE